jgi:hypothetical protein
MTLTSTAINLRRGVRAAAAGAARAREGGVSRGGAPVGGRAEGEPPLETSDLGWPKICKLARAFL